MVVRHIELETLSSSSFKDYGDVIDGASISSGSLINNGYTKNFLNQSLHSLLTLPFFLALMTGLASILTMYNLKKSKSLHVIVVGLVTVVIIYYLKDFSLALILSIWSPIIILTLLTFVGVLQINEK